MEKNCPRYDKELLKLYDSFKTEEERLTFPKIVPPNQFIYDKEKNYSHSKKFDDDVQKCIFPSETRKEFNVPQLSLVTKRLGKRRAMLEKFFWNQMAQEVIATLCEGEEELNYCTEYLYNYYKAGYPRDTEADMLEEKDTHLKYPLHGTGSNGVTIYSQTLRTPNQKNNLQPMKRSSDFTKLLSERFDNGWVL